MPDNVAAVAWGGTDVSLRALDAGAGQDGGLNSTRERGKGMEVQLCVRAVGRMTQSARIGMVPDVRFLDLCR